MDVCLQVLKQNNKSRYGSYKVTNTLLITVHLSITFRGCRLLNFPTTFFEKAVNDRCREETLVERHECNVNQFSLWQGNRLNSLIALGNFARNLTSQLSSSIEITNVSVDCAEFQINCRLFTNEKADI